ncbi:MAG TPA: hypothetical protein VEX68_00565 [Bryobacteraceae bacterium]|nr:hypothetical protein [Bryobacteraceae bacterium]
MSEIAGLPFWEMHFDENGNAKHFMDDVGTGVTDLFVFAHGWNNDFNDAKDLYTRYFEVMADVLITHGGKPGVAVGVAGVFWPSILWPDDEPERQSTGMASFGSLEKDWTAELKKAFPNEEQLRAIDRMRQLIDEQPNDDQSFSEFQSLLRTIAPNAIEQEDSGEAAVIEEDPVKVFEALADLAPTGRGGQAGLLDTGSRVWDGAREAARVASYWSMKERAGVVGERGLGSLLRRLPASLRIHLVGHSFGARLVSFALKANPANVKSLFLLQGAFSHYAFADSLPYEPGQGGALKDMASRVDGPILVSHSKLDSANCERYPVASWIMREAAAGITDDPKWMAMGADGAQAVSATEAPFDAVGCSYPFQKGSFVNLDGNHLITKGGWPAGAHSDIIYPEIAWAGLAAAGVVTPRT